MKKIFIFSLFGLFLLSSSLSVGAKNLNLGNKDNPIPIPPGVMPVVFLSGSPYEMGFQYGKQAKEYVLAAKTLMWALLIPKYGDKAAVLASMAKYQSNIERMTPEYVDIMKGMADGAEMDFEDALMMTCVVDLAWNRPSACTTISAWGDATAGGKVIGGSNLDNVFAIWSYQCIVIAYPSKGNSFISSAGAGWLSSNFVMNDKGLMYLSSAGEAGRPEDKAYGLPERCVNLHTVMFCDNAEEAKDFIVSVDKCGGDYRHVVDSSGNAYAIESTAAKVQVRAPGDFGEKDYLVASNHWITPEMKVCKRSKTYMSSIYRYATSEKYLQEQHGNLDVRSLMSILGESERYFDGKQWIFADWSTNTLDRRSKYSGTLARRIGVPEDKAVYILTGGSNENWGSGAPFHTGEYVNLFLEDSPASVAKKANRSARDELFLASKALDGCPNQDLKDKLNEAKSIFWKGNYYQAAAVVANAEKGEGNNKPYEALALYAKAVSCYCKAQAWAKQAARGVVK